MHPFKIDSQIMWGEVRSIDKIYNVRFRLKKNEQMDSYYTWGVVILKFIFG